MNSLRLPDWRRSKVCDNLGAEGQDGSETMLILPLPVSIFLRDTEPTFPNQQLPN